MFITKAVENDLQTILELQYLAYQSEAKLFHDSDIPPLKQTLQEVISEYKKGTILKALDGNNKIIGSVRAYCENGTVYIGKLIVHPDRQRNGIGTMLLLEIERLGYHIFQEKSVNSELKFVFLEKK